MHKVFSFFSFFIFGLLVFLGNGVKAADLGQKAQVFPIKEEAFTKMIKRKLENIDMEEHKRIMQEKTKDRVQNPVPVVGLVRARENRVFYHDPTYTLDEDAVLPCGKVLYRAGTKVNPLDHMDLDRRMIFIDARDEKQKEWLIDILNKPLIVRSEDEGEKSENQETPIEDRVILVGGSPLKLIEEISEAHKEKIFFDQSGELTNKFGIKAIPAVVVQEKRFLKIEEIALDK